MIHQHIFRKGNEPKIKINMQTMIPELEKRFRQVDLTVLDEMKHMISSKIDDKILPPYVPFIGKLYSKHRILVYATAQNISHGQAKSFGWSKPINRLYPDSDSSNISRDKARLGKVPIEPWSRGVLPALIGIFLYAKFDDDINDLEVIQDHVAVTNYYKFSLSCGKKDINPSRLAGVNKDTYLQLSNTLVKRELDSLEPSYLFWINGHHKTFLTDECRKREIKSRKVNDPAWIRRMPKCLRSSGSWGKEVDSAKNGTRIDRNRFEKAEELVSKYYLKIRKLNEKGGQYGAESRRTAIKYYLLYYFLQFIK